MITSFNSVVGAKINDFQFARYLMTFNKLFRIAMCRTEKENINFGEGKLICKDKISFSIQSAMHVCYLISCITAAVYKSYFNIRMVNKQTNQFACRITSTTYNTCANHYCLFLF